MSRVPQKPRAGLGGRSRNRGTDHVCSLRRDQDRGRSHKPPPPTPTCRQSPAVARRRPSGPAAGVRLRVDPLGRVGSPRWGRGRGLVHQHWPAPESPAHHAAMRPNSIATHCSRFPKTRGSLPGAGQARSSNSASGCPQPAGAGGDVTDAAWLPRLWPEVRVTAGPLSSP